MLDESNFPEGYRVGKTKYIVITGSVISGVGKGTFTSCLGTLLKLFHGFRLAPIKFDGYLNYDSGTLNPYRHGEVFVLDDGTECDLDLGTYERMMDLQLIKDNYLTAGKIFKTIIDKERAGGYLGKDVQFIPHVTGEIKRFIRNLAVKSDADIVLIEVGGTVGDLENSYFIEAMRELAYEEGKKNVCFVAVVYILEPGSLGEQKSKAAQLGIRRLMELGIQPDLIVCRGESPVKDSIREKLSIFSNVPLERVISSSNVKNIHEIPLVMKDMGVDRLVINTLGLKEIHKRSTDAFEKWKDFVAKSRAAKKEVKIAITGKYTDVHDSYISILKALEHSFPQYGCTAKPVWIDTTDICDADIAKALSEVDGVIVPIGFGSRGAEGKIRCIKYARTNKLPFLGLCFGFQMAVVEFARNICGLEAANSTEVDPDTDHPVIDILPEQKELLEKCKFGASMRLGGYAARLKSGTHVYSLYGKPEVRVRHRHRYEVNLNFIPILEKHGLAFSGYSPEKRLMEFLELPGHPFFVATQGHPEYTSKPLNPDPLFLGFAKAVSERVAGQKSIKDAV